MSTTTLHGYLQALRTLVAAAQFGGQAACTRVVVARSWVLPIIEATNAMPAAIIHKLPSRGVHAHTTKLARYRVGIALWDVSHGDDTGEAGYLALEERLAAIVAHLAANGPGTGALWLRVADDPAQITDWAGNAGNVQGLMQPFECQIRRA